MDRRVVIALGDDWSGLYIDGKLVHEGHNIDETWMASLLSEHLGIDMTAEWVDLDWIYDRGRLPESIEDVEWEE